MGDQTDSGIPLAESGAPAEGWSRERAIWLGAALFLLVSLVIGIVVFAGADDDSGSDQLQAADGVLVDADHDRLRMTLFQPIDGRDELELVVAPSDRAQLDIPHLEEHVRTRLPTRVYYERDGDEYLARQAVDLPALP